MALEDKFQSAKIEGRDSAPGAEQYSFFGSFEDCDDDGLGGGLEDGVAAPPEEEKRGNTSELEGLEDLGDLDPELAGSGPDMSFATMFAISSDATAPTRVGTPALSLDALASASIAVDVLLDDPWGQLPGLSVSRRHEAYNAPQLPSVHQQPLSAVGSEEVEVPYAADARYSHTAMDARQGQALQGSGLLIVDQRMRPTPHHYQRQDQAAVPPPWGGQAHSQMMHREVSDQMPSLQMRPQQQQQDQYQQQCISTPMTVTEVEAQMRAHSLGVPPAPPNPAQIGGNAHQPQQSSSRPSPPMTLQQQQHVAAAAAAAQAAYRNRPTQGLPLPMQHIAPIPHFPILGSQAARGAPAVQFSGLPLGHPGLMARRPQPGWRPLPPHPSLHPGTLPNGRSYGVPPPRPPPGSPPGPLGARAHPPQGAMPPQHLIRRPPGPQAPGPQPSQEPPGMHVLPWGMHLQPRGPHVLEPRPGRPQMVGSRRQQYESKCMSRDEIDTILRIQWRSLHNGPPYQEDYYFQAFINKHGGGRNARWFAPESIRQLAPSERCAAEATTFLSVDGLGRIPFSNVRRPRPLMDLASASPNQGAEGDGGSDSEAVRGALTRRPLEQEPALAARIMIEDCLALLLDVQDIDCVFAASPGGAPEGEAALRRRRALLMDGLAASLRLQQPPYLSAAADAAINASSNQQPQGDDSEGGEGKAHCHSAHDGVLQRLLSLRKGRDLLARSLALSVPPQGAHVDRGASWVAVQSPALVFGLLRNLRAVFRKQPASGQGESRGQSQLDDVAVGARVAVAALEVVRHLESPAALAAALAAIVDGDLPPQHTIAACASSRAEERAPEGNHSLLPMYPPDEMAGGGRLWLADLLAAVLVRAAETEAPLTAHPSVPPWTPSWASFAKLLLDHLSTLKAAHSRAVAQGMADAAKMAQDAVPVVLIRAALPHCTQPQRLTIHATLTEITSQPRQTTPPPLNELHVDSPVEVSQE